MLHSDIAAVGVMMLGALLVAASHNASAASPISSGAQIFSVAAGSASGSGASSGFGALTQQAAATASASASARASASATTGGQGNCNAQSTSEAVARLGNKVVRRSSQKRAEQEGGCSASAESSAEVGPEPSGTPQR